MTQTGITGSKSVTAEQHNNMPDEEPSQMSMQNGPRGAYIFNAVPSKFLGVTYSYPECFPRSPAMRQFPMFATHILFFFFFSRQTGKQIENETRGP